MSKISETGRAVRAFLKKRLIEEGKTYAMLARELGISEQKIKRRFSSQDFRLDELVQICHVLKVELFPTYSGKPEFGRILKFVSRLQEKFLSENPRAAAIFLLIFTSHDAEKISAELKLSAIEVRRSLGKLEKANFIRIHPGDRIEIRVRGPLKWRKNGSMMKRYYRPLAEQIFSRFLENFPDGFEDIPTIRGSTFFRPFEVYLTEKSANALAADLTKVLTRYRSLSLEEAKSKKRLQPYTGLVGLQPQAAWMEVFKALS